MSHSTAHAIRYRTAQSHTFISAVRALKSLQKDMMLSPACPSAGPTGGAGLACPAGTIKRTTDLTVLDMVPGVLHLPQDLLAPQVLGVTRGPKRGSLASRIHAQRRVNLS